MAEREGVWGCDTGDKVKHFYILTNSERAPVCDPTNSQVRFITTGGKKQKCKACLLIVSG